MDINTFVLVVSFLNSSNIMVSNPMPKEVCEQMIPEVKGKIENVKEVKCMSKKSVDEEFPTDVNPEI